MDNFVSFNCLSFSLSLVSGQVLITCGSNLAALLFLGQVFSSQDYFLLQGHTKVHLKSK